MKRVIAAVAAAVIFSANSYAADTLYINGHKTDALISSGAERVAVRGFFQSAGYTVQWNSTGRYASIYNDDTKIVVFAGKPFIFASDSLIRTEAAAEITDGSLVMPVSAAVNALGADIEYINGDIYITSDKASDTSAWAYEILRLTNAERVAHGLPELIWNPSLADAAQKHCRDMAARGFFSHETPEGNTPFDRMTALGIKYTYAAENIAAGQPSPESAFASWLGSAGHRDNILNPRLNEMGAAFSYGGKYGIYWAQEFAAEN